MTPMDRIALDSHETALEYCTKMLDIVQSEALQDKFLNQAIDHETAIAQLRSKT